jgi:hypothetical protein
MLLSGIQILNVKPIHEHSFDFHWGRVFPGERVLDNSYCRLCLRDRLEANRVKAYIRKYTEDIKDLDMTVAEFSEAYAIPILIIPQSMRGFVD